jgi:hypothetical protein
MRLPRRQLVPAAGSKTQAALVLTVCSSGPDWGDTGAIALRFDDPYARSTTGAPVK